MQTITIVEDDASICQLICYALKSAGYEAEAFESGTDFFETLQAAHSGGASALPDLILLDIMLPDMDGIDILRRMRALSWAARIPVMMLTAKGAEYDKVNALDLGADDYMTKPFGVMELISRVKALLRRSAISGDSAEHFTLGALDMDIPRRAVFVDGAEVVLTFKEFELLRYLLQNKGIVLSRDRIMQTVWGFDFEGESRTVDMHIKLLRQKLGNAGECIRTVRGVGYKIEE